MVDAEEEALHVFYMRKALVLAAQGLGRTAPNPAVGCVIVRDGAVCGAARTADGGRPHAETQALAQAGIAARGADVYVTLEPCGNHGVTPPCVEALIAAGVRRVFIACHDVNQKNNSCTQRLEKSGIKTFVGVMEREALSLNEGFFKTIEQGRPLVSAKVAASLDGRIATAAGESKWITGAAARHRAHELRACHDAVLAGIGTVLADDPLLTVRLPDHDGRQPVRIVIDPDLRLPLKSALVSSAEGKAPVWALCRQGADEARRKVLEGKGIAVIAVQEETGEGMLAINGILKTFVSKGITRLLVEGGSATLSAFLKAGAVDRLYWFRAPKLIGGDGVPVFQGLGIRSIGDALDLALEERCETGEDLLEIWRLKG